MARKHRSRKFGSPRAGQWQWRNRSFEFAAHRACDGRDPRLRGIEAQAMDCSHTTASERVVAFFALLSGDRAMSGINKLSATFQHVVFSQVGDVEGMLVDVDGAPAQVVLKTGDEAAASLVAALREGQVLSCDVEPAEPEKDDASVHPVLILRELLQVDGAAPKAPEPAKPAPFSSGKVVRLNFTRHGVPNGYVLDNGDFLLVQPEWFAKLGLGIGDRVEVDGDACYLATGDGWAVEAETVNGRPIR
jgi:hypothetical protein